MIFISLIELSTRVGNGLMLVLVGNKMDLTENLVVSKTTANEYADSIGATFLETSALDNTGIFPFIFFSFFQL